MSTLIYKNTTSSPIRVIGVGEVPAFEHVSITSKYQPHVVVENYPGLIEISELDLALLPKDHPALVVAESKKEQADV